MNGMGACADVLIPMVKRGMVDFAVGADWTPAAGDMTISEDVGVTTAAVTHKATAGAGPP